MKLKVGYELGTGKVVNIDLNHLIITGTTQTSGKSSCLEGMASRLKDYKIIIFKTKVGEKSFTNGNEIPLFFKHNTGWEFVLQLLELTMKEKLNTKFRAKIIQCSEDTETLEDVHNNILEALNAEKVSVGDKDCLVTINAYLENILPKLEKLDYSHTLDIKKGVNIMDLTTYGNDLEIQSIIIANVMDEVLNNFKETVVIISESWKYTPQRSGSPCKLSIEQFIRQGGTNGNYLFLESQDMASIDKTPLKQMHNWLLGRQSEKNEVLHTIVQIPLPPDYLPTSEEIMGLKVGQFIVISGDEVTKTYAQPIFLGDKWSKAVAQGPRAVNKLLKEVEDKDG